MSACELCGVSIADRHHNALYCVPCVRLRERRQRSEYNLYQTFAMSYVTAAIRHGDLPQLDGSIKCADCNAPAAHYDHRDYKLPLAVDPVCRKCNARRGPALHKDPRETGTPRLTLRKRMEAA